MDFNADVYASDGLYGYFFKYICEKFIKYTYEYKDLDEFITKNKIDIKVKECYTSDVMSQELRLHKGHITKDYAKKMFRDWRDKERHSHLGVYTEWGLENGKVTIIRFTLQIRTAPLCIYICEKAYDLELVKKEMDWMIKHEIGHMIDYVRNRHGISVNEFKALCERDQKNYEKYYEHLATIEEWTTEEALADNRRYYEIEQEATANAAAGIDVSEMIDYERAFVDKYKNKIIGINIHQTGIKEAKKKNES